MKNNTQIFLKSPYIDLFKLFNVFSFETSEKLGDVKPIQVLL